MLRGVFRKDSMTDIIDIHTHTIASMHAYSTIREMAAAAKEKGLALIGISDHAPGLPGTFPEMYFRNFKVIRPAAATGSGSRMNSEEPAKKEESLSKNDRQ